MRQKQKKEYFVCYIYMKTRNVSYFLCNKIPNVEGFQDLPQHLQLERELDIQCLKNLPLGVQ